MYIIIGSGLSGLAAAAYLAHEGYEVVIYEQYSEIGGVTATIHKEGYSWDIGPLLIGGLGSHEIIGKVLIDLGLYDKIKLIQDDRGQSLPDFDLWRPEKYEGPYWRRERFKEIFPNEAEGLDHYYKFYDKIMSLMAILNRAELSTGLKSAFLKLRALLGIIKVKKMMNWSASEVLDYFFEDPKLKAVFTGILADFVVKPSEFPGLGIPAVNVETAFDKRIPIEIKGGKLPIYNYVKGGCENLVNALADFIKNKGGKIYTNSLVKKIKIENNQVKGITLENGDFIPADIVIASGGPRKVWLELVGSEHLPEEFVKNVENLRMIESVLMVHIGIDFDPTPYQRKPLCYYYRTYDIEESVDRCRSGDYHEGKEGFLIYIPSMHSPEMAPEGKHAVTVYTIAPDKLNKGSWKERREELADKLLMEAEKIIPGLREKVLVKIIMTPEDFRTRINVNMHSFGGTAPIMRQKNPPHRSPVKGLWYIGAYSESGGGFTGAVNSARKTVHLILKQK